MKKFILVALVALALALPSFAGVRKVPKDNPVATVTAPDSWKAEDYDEGVELTSDDGEVYIAVEATETKAVSKSMEEAVAFLNKKGVTVDDKTVKTQEGKIGANDSVSISWDGKDEDGPARVELMVLDLGGGKGVLLIYWASPDGEKKHQKDISAIAGSVKKA